MPFCILPNLEHTCKDFFLFISVENITLSNNKFLTIEICSAHKCLIQGQQCLIDEPTVKPYCKCIQQCPRVNKPVCGSDTATTKYSRLQTFTNRCTMDRQACERKRSIRFLYEGSCRFKPKTRTYLSNWIERMKNDKSFKILLPLYRHGLFQQPSISCLV